MERYLGQRIQTSNYKMNKLRKSNIQQYTRASLVAQLVKNPPVMQETPVGFLGREDPLEKGKATHSSILARKIPWTISPWGHRVGHD